MPFRMLLIVRHCLTSVESIALASVYEHPFSFVVINRGEALKSAHVKNVVECKQKIIKQFLKDYISRGQRKCPRCHNSQPGLAMYHNTKIVFTSKHRQLAVKQKVAKRTAVPK